MPTRVGITPLELLARRANGGYSQGGGMSSRDNRFNDATEPFGNRSPGGFGVGATRVGETPLELLARASKEGGYSQNSGGMSGRDRAFMDASEPFGAMSPGGFGLPARNAPGFQAGAGYGSNVSWQHSAVGCQGAGGMSWNPQQGWRRDTFGVKNIDLIGAMRQAGASYASIRPRTLSGSMQYWKSVVGGQALSPAQAQELYDMMENALEGAGETSAVNPMLHGSGFKPLGGHLTPTQKLTTAQLVQAMKGMGTEKVSATSNVQRGGFANLL